jgi:gamma-glutamylcyclotransferase (GGCT)/AIG2-like uncharacterized protein YtfP
MMPDSDSASAQRHVFVYGTLRGGGSNDIAQLARAARLAPPLRVDDASIAGTLYDLGAYPGALLGGTDRVHGEIYRIDAALEARLDRLEEVAPDDSGEYRKRERVVEAGARRWTCLVYEINPERIVGRAVIAGGDWFAAR